MKIFVTRFTLFIAALAFSPVCHAQVVEPKIEKGSVIIYEVKENTTTYQYTVTVTKFSEADGVELKWKTNEKPARSGTTSMAFSALDDATRLKIKLVSGNEKLGKDQLRVFFSNDVVTNLVGNKYVYIAFDEKEDMFLYTAKKAETAEIDYGGKKIKVDYTSGDAGKTQIGFISIGDYQVVHTFMSKDLSFTLKSISGK